MRPNAISSLATKTAVTSASARAAGPPRSRTRATVAAHDRRGVAPGRGQRLAPAVSRSPASTHSAGPATCQTVRCPSRAGARWRAGRPPSWSTATTCVDAEREPSIVTVGIRRLISSVAALPAITGTASTMPSTACSARHAIESAIDSGAERSRRRDAHAVAGRARGAFHAVADDGARVVHGGHADDADDAAAARREHARGGVAPVAELRDRGLDLRARARGDIRGGC